MHVGADGTVRGGRGSTVASSEDIHTHTCSYSFTVTPQSLGQPHMVRQPQTESYSLSHTQSTPTQLCFHNHSTTQSH